MYLLRAAGFLCLALNFACSVPVLQEQACTDARYALRQFYSFHFDKGMEPSEEGLVLREQYLTGGLVGQLKKRPDAEGYDYFTDSIDHPKAFRVGECKFENNTALIQVLMLWKNDEESRQRALNVEMINSGGSWLINNVF